MRRVCFASCKTASAFVCSEEYRRDDFFHVVIPRRDSVKCIPIKHRVLPERFGSTRRQPKISSSYFLRIPPSRHPHISLIPETCSKRRAESCSHRRKLRRRCRISEVNQLVFHCRASLQRGIPIRSFAREIQPE